MAYYKRREVFFMSLEEERKVLFPLYYMYYEIERAHASDRLNEDRLDEIRAKKQEEMLEAFRASKVDLSKVREIGDRLVNQKWYSVYYIPQEQTDAPQTFTEDRAPYAMLTSDNHRESTKLLPKDYPDFYAMIDPDAPQLKSNIQFWARARSALKLPKDYLFINLGALEVILAVLQLTAGEDEEALIPQIPAILAANVSKVEIQLDKLNNIVFGQSPKKLQQIEGQLSVFDGNIEMGKEGEGALVYCCIDYEELKKDKGLKLSTKLTPYDDRVYQAINAIYNSKPEKVQLMTISQIYRAMGNEGQPSSFHFEKINNSITKMFKAWLTLDNKLEAEKHKSQDRFKYDGAVLYGERVSGGFVNGKFTEAIIHIMREPTLISFSKAHGQVTTVNLSLLQAPISQTDRNLLLFNYLLTRCAKIKTKHSPKKILLSTVYENTDITTVKQKQRAPETIKRILDHFKREGYIKSYKMDKTSLEVQV